jgi:hypothetical protein
MDTYHLLLAIAIMWTGVICHAIGYNKGHRDGCDSRREMEKRR